MLVKRLYQKGFFHLLSAQYLGQFFGFGTVLLVAKLLTEEELGALKLIQSYTAIFMVLGGLGLNTAVLKLAAEERPVDERLGILRYGLGRAVVASVASWGLLAALALSGVISDAARSPMWLPLYALVIPLGVVTQLVVTYLQAVKSFKRVAAVQVTVRLQTFALILALTWIIGFPGFIFASIAGAVLAFLPLLRQVDWSAILRARPLRATSFYWLALLALAGNGVNVVGQYADMFILDHLVLDRAEIGRYALATVFYQGARQVIATVQSYGTPQFSENAGNEAWFRHNLRLNQRRATLLSFAVAGAMWVFAWVLVQVLYGESYASALSYLSVLLVRFVLYAAYAVIGVALLGLGYIQFNLAAAVVSTGVGIAASLLLIGDHGLLGVAWGQVIGQAAGYAASQLGWIVAARRAFPGPGPAAS